jgi:hypothetical protein
MRKHVEQTNHFTTTIKNSIKLRMLGRVALRVVQYCLGCESAAACGRPPPHPRTEWVGRGGGAHQTKSMVAPAARQTSSCQPFTDVSEKGAQKHDMRHVMRASSRAGKDDLVQLGARAIPHERSNSLTCCGRTQEAATHSTALMQCAAVAPAAQPIADSSILAHIWETICIPVCIAGQ